MPSARVLLPGAKDLRPLTQGNLSCLCGLYSILNGIRIMLYPQRLTKAQLQDLYVLGLNQLSKRKQLKRIIGVGMPEETWLELAAFLTHHVNEQHGTALTVKQSLKGSARHSRTRALRIIQRSLTGGSALLAGLGGLLDHYTVLVGYTDKRLLLFDSSGLRWVEVRCVGLGEGSPRLHRLYPDSLSSLVDDW